MRSPPPQAAIKHRPNSAERLWLHQTFHPGVERSVVAEGIVAEEVIRSGQIERGQPCPKALCSLGMGGVERIVKERHHCLSFVFLDRSYPPAKCGQSESICVAKP